MLTIWNSCRTSEHDARPKLRDWSVAAALVTRGLRFSATAPCRRILLDDGRNGENRQPVYFLGADQTLRLGDTIQTLIGAMHYAFGAYRV